MTPLQQASIAKAQQCIQQASAFFNRPFSLPEINFTQRGKIAGTARLQGWEIRINPVLLEENQQTFINEVIPHEIAHLITFKLYGRVRPHGKEWQGVMNQVFNLPARTTHSFSVDSVKGKTFPYCCKCTTHELTVRRHNRVQRKETQYLCKACQSPLKLSRRRLQTTEK